MGLKTPGSAGTNLPVVLELSPQPDGTARGEVDGVPVSFEADGRVRILLSGSWPGSIVSIPEPVESPLSRPTLRNRSRYPAWMSVALGRALSDQEVQKAIDGLSPGAVRVEVHDDALWVDWLGEPDGPSVRRTVKALTPLARALPASMAQIVARGVKDELDGRQRAALQHGRDRLRAASPEALLSDQYDLLARQVALRMWTTVLGPLAAIPVGLALMVWLDRAGIPLMFLLSLGLFFSGAAWAKRLRFTSPCPRCGAPRASRPSEIVNDPRCPHCRLGPSRPLRFRMPNDTDRIDL